MKRQTNLSGVQVVKRKHADGSVAVHYYHRATRTKLPGKPGSPEFDRALSAARNGSAAARRPAPEANLAALIRNYCVSAEWNALAESTRANARLDLKAVEDAWGDLPLTVCANKRLRALVLVWRDELAERHPRAADAKAGAFARVLSWGLDRGLVADNPLTGIKRVYKSDRADLIWRPKHVAAFLEVARPEIRLAMMLALHTGQRQGDIRTLTWACYDGRAISLRQGKSRRWVWVPCTAALKATLDALPRPSNPTAPILANTRGGPWEKRAFARAWGTAYRAAKGLPTGEGALHFHDLRGTAVTMLSEAGATPQEIATITGHTFVSVHHILEAYLSRTKTLAQRAIDKFENCVRVDVSKTK